VDRESESDNDSEVQEFKEETGESDGDNSSMHSSDGYISDSAGSDSGEHSGISEKETTHSQLYHPPQLQPTKDKLKLRKSINGLINRLCRVLCVCAIVL